MPHVALVPLSGFRIREERMLELGMSLPGLHPRMAAIGELPALGLLTLAGLLPEAWQCSYHPFARVDDSTLETLVALRPDLVAVSALTASISEAYRLAARLREHGIRTVLGGLHATVCPEEAGRWFDAIVTGPGERVWRIVLRDVEQSVLKPRYEGRSVVASPVDEDSLWPVPRFDLLGQRPHRLTMQTQRGCPFACDFCGASRLLGRFIEKPADRIREELTAIRQIRSRPLIELADDNTFAGTRSTDELLNVLQDSQARWFTEADWRIGERPELLKRLATAGCRQVLVGIESIVFRYPGMGAKQAELNRIMAALDCIQDAGVAVNGCFILGADGETRDSIDRLVSFILKSNLAEVQLTLQTPFPGTGLNQRLQQQGRILPERDWSFHTLFDVTYRPDRMSVEELEQSFRDAVRQVFASDACSRRDRLRESVWRSSFHPDVSG